MLLTGLLRDLEICNAFLIFLEERVGVLLQFFVLARLLFAPPDDGRPRAEAAENLRLPVNLIQRIGLFLCQFLELLGLRGQESIHFGGARRHFLGRFFRVAVHSFRLQVCLRGNYDSLLRVVDALAWLEEVLRAVRKQRSILAASPELLHVHVPTLVILNENDAIRLLGRVVLITQLVGAPLRKQLGWPLSDGASLPSRRVFDCLFVSDFHHFRPQCLLVEHLR